MDTTDTRPGKGEGKESLGKQALIVSAAAAAVAAVFLLTWHAVDVFLLIFAGALLSVLLYGLASRLSSLLPLSYRWCFGVVIISMVAILGLLGWFFADRISGEMDQLSERLPKAASQLLERLERYDWIKRAVDGVPGPERLLRNQPELMNKATGIVSTTFSAITSGFVILFISLYLSFDSELYKRGILTLIPARRERAAAVLSKLRETLWWWLLAHFGSMTVVGILTTIGLWVLGIPLALALGVIAAVLAFIPNIGPVLAAVPAILLAVTESPDKALYVVFLYIGVQAVETNLITPVFELKAVSMPPALTISVQLLLGSLAGILGLLLASPICAASMVLVQMLYVEDWLQERE